MATTSGVTSLDAACRNLQTRVFPHFVEVSEDDDSSVPGRWSRRPCLGRKQSCRGQDRHPGDGRASHATDRRRRGEAPATGAPWVHKPP